MELDYLIARAVGGGDPIPTWLQRHWFQEAASVSNILGEGKVEAQVVCNVTKSVILSDRYRGVTVRS